MRCAGCRHELEVGDRYIKDTPSVFIGKAPSGFDDLLADVLGGAGGEVVYCEDCTEPGGHWLFDTVYGDEDDASAR